MTTLTRDAALALYRITCLAVEDGLPATMVRDNLLDYHGITALDTATPAQIAALLSTLRRARHYEPPSEVVLHVIAVNHATLRDEPLR